MTNSGYDRRSFLKTLTAFAASANLSHENLLSPLLHAELPPMNIPTTSLAALCHTVTGSFDKCLGRLQELQEIGVGMFINSLETDPNNIEAIENLRTDLKTESVNSITECSDTIVAMLSNPRNTTFLRNYAELCIQEMSTYHQATQQMIDEYKLRTNSTDEPGVLWVKASQERRFTGDNQISEISSSYRIKKEELLSEYKMPKELVDKWDRFLKYFASGTSTSEQKKGLEELFNGSWATDRVKSLREFWDSPSEEVAKSFDWATEYHNKKRLEFELKRKERSEKQKSLNSEIRELEFISWYGPFINRAAFR